MPKSSMNLILLHMLAGLSLSSGQSCVPRYPAVIPAPGGDDPSQVSENRDWERNCKIQTPECKDNGIFYVYRQNGNVTVNQIVTVTGYGPTVDPSILALSYRQYIQIAYSESTQRPVCHNQFTVQVYATSGLIFGNQASSSDTSITFSLFTVLYHDYANLVLVYGCAVPKSDGTCATPIILAETRVKPDQLTPDQMATFDGIINKALKDYCITTDLLPKQIYDNYQAQCPNLDPPACLQTVIKRIQETPALNLTDGQTTTPPPATGSPIGCQRPSSLPATVNYDPASEGLWYVYRQVSSHKPSGTNMRITWHNMGKGYRPQNNLTGNYMWAEATARFDAAYTTQCSSSYWTLFLGSNGADLGYSFASSGGSTVPLRATTAYADDQFQFFYTCETPNLQTKMCSSPFGFFAARSDPSQWSDADKARADSIIDRLLRDYGCSSKDIPLMPQLPGQPVCASEGGTAAFEGTCMSQYVAGWSGLAEPVKSGY